MGRAAIDQREDAGSTQAFLCALDPCHPVRELIHRRFQIEMPILDGGRVPQALRFTPQKPLKKAYEQKPEFVEAWLKGKAIQRLQTRQVRRGRDSLG